MLKESDTEQEEPAPDPTHRQFVLNAMTEAADQTELVNDLQERVGVLQSQLESGAPASSSAPAELAELRNFVRRGKKPGDRSQRSHPETHW